MSPTVLQGIDSPVAKVLGVYAEKVKDCDPKKCYVTVKFHMHDSDTDTWHVVGECADRFALSYEDVLTTLRWLCVEQNHPCTWALAKARELLA